MDENQINADHYSILTWSNCNLNHLPQVCKTHNNIIIMLFKNYVMGIIKTEFSAYVYLTIVFISISCEPG